MIVNSHPYNPSQRSQQHRCVGINQQNSLYGSKLAPADMPPLNQHHQQQHHQQARPATHLFDLAPLQQAEQTQAANSNNLFDSAYYDASTNSLAPPAATFGQSEPKPQASQAGKMMNGASNKQLQTTDVSLYSPSSSTSLLYHHYDQINVPNDHQSVGQLSDNATTNNGNFKRSNTTTILNPANLFNQAAVASQHQHSMPGSQQANQQIMINSKTTIPQQELYSSGTQYHLHQPSFNTLHHHHQLAQQQQQQHNSTYGLDNHQLMLDTILRQQHASAAATSRLSQHGYHNRPLSSSGASSMSGQSMALTYGRQPRQANGQLPPLPPINSSKSQNTLASVLQSNQTLNHLGLSLNGHLTPTMMTDTRGPKKISHQHHQFPSSSSGVGGATGGVTSRRWKRLQQRVQNFAYQYSTLLRFAMLLILLAFTVMSVLKFASMSNPPATSNPSNPVLGYQQQVASHSGNMNLAQSNMNPLIYPPTKLMDSAARPDVDLNKWAVTEQYASNEGSTAAPDVLSSKLLIGEFVILSQNYSSSDAQRSVLAENIVKLMDQVFLSTDVRRVYSRMQVVEIRPHMPSGITVKCNIILSESIVYAAQQFGIALYDSLAKSNEKLANQPSFIVDKNSIRFNTIPDKDLAMVPPQLLPTAMARPDASQPPSDGPAGKQQQLDYLKSVMATGGDQPQDQSAVVWSEWSQWSSCVDKNGVCDPTRLHSRLRKCVSQHTGEKVEASECRQRFNMQDLELEVTDCSAACANSPMGPPQQQAGVQSDAPLVIMPHTAPSMMVANPSSEPTPTFLLPAPLNRGSKQPQQQPQANQKLYEQTGAADIYGQSLADSGAGRQQGGALLGAVGLLTSTQTSAASVSTQDSPAVIAATQASAGIPTGLPALGALDSQQQQMSCSNCTSDEICLLLVTQKVPFCAKIKDRLDESGCGGWCKAKDEVCQPAGQNAFKCTHNSECLPHEWRCHDSQCIPASKRCDGHENCFDSSDERYCPSS